MGIFARGDLVSYVLGYVLGCEECLVSLSFALISVSLSLGPYICRPIYLLVYMLLIYTPVSLHLLVYTLLAYTPVSLHLLVHTPSAYLPVGLYVHQFMYLLVNISTSQLGTELAWTC
jgi:hypothetical protein